MIYLQIALIILGQEVIITNHCGIGTFPSSYATGKWPLNLGSCANTTLPNAVHWAFMSSIFYSSSSNCLNTFINDSRMIPTLLSCVMEIEVTTIKMALSWFSFETLSAFSAFHWSQVLFSLVNLTLWVV